MASTTHRLLDPDTLAAALETDDSATLIDFYEMFADLTREAWPELVSATSRDDFATVGAIAHKLVSSSATIGVTALAAALRALEDLANGRHSESVRACVDETANLVTASLDAVDRHIDQLKRR